MRVRNLLFFSGAMLAAAFAGSLVVPKPVMAVARELIELQRDVTTILTYRYTHGITNPDTALGPEPADIAQRRSWDLARLAIIGHERGLNHDRGLER